MSSFGFSSNTGSTSSSIQKSYTTYALMDADKVNIPANTSVTITNDTDSTKNGMYAYNGTVFTKSDYDPLTLANSYTTSALAVTNAAVDKLKSPNIAFTPLIGFIASANHASGQGAILTQSGYEYTPLLQVKKGDVIEVTAKASNNILILSKWTASGVFIAPLVVGSTVTSKHIYTVVDDIEYVRACNTTSLIAAIYFKVQILSAITVQGNNIKLTESSIALAKLRYVEPSVLAINWTGGYVNSTEKGVLEGTVTSNGTGYIYSQLLTVYAGDKLKLHIGALSSVQLLSKRDVSGAYITQIFKGQADSKLDFEYVATDEIEYLIVTSNTNTVPLADTIITYEPNAINSLAKRASALEDTNKALLSLTHYRPEAIRKPVINFQFDDGTASDATVFTMFNSYGFKCGFALMSGSANNYNLYRNYQEQGFEVLSHSTVHTAMSGNGATVEDYETRFKTSKATLIAEGLDVVGWVTPNSTLNVKYLEALKRHYEYGFTVYQGEWLSTSPENPYNVLSEDTRGLKRISMESSSIENIKAAIDKVILDGGMLTFYAHSVPDTLLSVAKLTEVLDYVKLKTDAGSCLVLKPTDAYQHYYTLRHSDIRTLITP